MHNEKEQNDVTRCLKFVKDNQEFFAAPFLKPQPFKRWVKSLSLDELNNIIILTHQLTKHGEQFERALVGKSIEDTDCLFCGDLVRLSLLFRENSVLVNCLLEFQKTEAISLWNMKYIDMHPCTIYIESILNQLSVIKLKSKFCNTSDEIRTLEFVKAIKKETLLFKIDMHKTDDVRELIQLFKSRLLNIIGDHEDVQILKACIQNSFIFGIQDSKRDSFFQIQDEANSANITQPNTRQPYL